MFHSLSCRFLLRYNGLFITETITKIIQQNQSDKSGYSFLNFKNSYIKEKTFKMTSYFKKK